MNLPTMILVLSLMVTIGTIGLLGYSNYQLNMIIDLHEQVAVEKDLQIATLESIIKTKQSMVDMYEKEMKLVDDAVKDMMK